MKKTLMLCGLFILTSYLFAYEMPFMSKGVRPMGMGGAFTGVADDENALFYNGAGLALYEKRGLSIAGSYVQQNFLTYGFENYFKAQADILYAQKNFGGYFSFTSEGNQRCAECPSNYEPNDNLFEIRLAAAHMADARVALGVDFKFSNLFNWKNTRTDSYSVGAGALVHVTDYFDAGLQMQSVFNFSRYIYRLWNYEGTPLGYTNANPFNINIGLAWRPFEGLLIAADVKNVLEPEVVNQFIYSGDVLDHVDSVFYARSYNLGAEYIISDMLTLRAGGYFTSYPVNFSYHLSTGQETDRYLTAATLGLTLNLWGVKSDLAVVDEFRGADGIFEPLKYHLSGTYLF